MATTTTTAPPVILSTIAPDYALILQQFDNVLPTQQSWADMYYGSTGQAVLRYIASVGNLDQFAIEHAYRENFRQARLDSSIMGQARLLGVRSPRKTPCGIPVTLVNQDNTALVIPAYTQFTVGGTLVFNREVITFTTLISSVNVTLYEGTVESFSLRSDGSKYQIFVSQETGYQVSDLDVVVTDNSTPVPVAQRPIWLYNGQAAVEDTTTPTGQLQLMFGDGTYGTQPAVNDVVTIVYAVTQGAEGENAGLSGQTVTCSAYSYITGTATGGLTGGTDQRDTTYFRQLSPQLFAAKTTATTQEEMSAVAASYPGVLDAQVLGQRSLAPGDVRYMNLVAVSLLTEAPFSAYDWDQFVAWFRKRCTYPVVPFRQDPQALTTAIVADVYCQGIATDLSSVQQEAMTKVQALFAPRTGIINSNLYLSDIINTIKTSDPTIEYLNLYTPSAPVVSQVEAPVVTLTPQVGDGTLAAGQYTYGVTVVTSQGESLATNFTSVNLNATGAVQLQWTANQSLAVLGYNIYGRTPVGLGLLASVGPNVNSWLDTGTASVGANPPALNTSGFYYPAVSTITLNMYYTNRLLSTN